jgi:hypothetical protein
MKILATCVITGRGEALFTDQEFSWPLWSQVKTNKKIRFADAGRVVELDIKSAEAAKKERSEVLAFLVQAMPDEATRKFVVGREYQLL